MSFRVVAAGCSARRSVNPPRLSRLLPLSLAIAAMLPGAVLAADAGDSDELDQVVVTATRTAVTTDATLAPVEVITRDEIEGLQAIWHSPPCRRRCPVWTEKYEIFL